MRPWTQEEFDALHEVAVDAALSSNQRVPVPGSWGIASDDDGPGFLASTLTFRQWFDDREGLVDFLEHHFVPALNNGKIAEAYERHKALSAIAHKWRRGELTRDEVVTELNTALRYMAQIAWIGTFEELIEDDLPYCRDMRGFFRENDEAWEDEPHPDPEAPIAPEEVEAFVRHMLNRD